jgi:hypothetical protein
MIEASLLDSGEQVIWSGKPNAAWYAFRRLNSHGLSSFAFFMFTILLFTSLFTLLAKPAGAPAPPDPTTVKFGVALAFLCLTAIVWLCVCGSRTQYLLTNRRLVIDTLRPSAKRISVPLEHVRFIELRSGLFGPGDLIFHETSQRVFGGWGFRNEGFIAIREAKQVERLLREAIDQTFTARTRGPWQ